jgi:hypothetical protein
MTKVNGFAFSNKSSISLSGVALSLTNKDKDEYFQLFRQFEDYEKELLIEFNLNIKQNKIITFDIKSKVRDVIALINTIKPRIAEITSVDEEDIDLFAKDSPAQKQILNLWQENFNKDEFIKDSYTGFLFLDTQKRLWIYDMIPAIKEFTCINSENSLPLPDTPVTYSIISSKTQEEVFSKSFFIPALIEGDLGIMDIFSSDIYLYHIALIYKNKSIWGVFSSKMSKRKSILIKSSSINNKSFLCSIKPDLNTYPLLKPVNNLFLYNDIPPSISKLELMDSLIRLTRIKIDTGSPDEFNTLSFQTKFFKTSNFPRTFALIYPYK